MTYNEKHSVLDPMTILMGLAYATTILVAIGWIATI